MTYDHVTWSYDAEWTSGNLYGGVTVTCQALYFDSGGIPLATHAWLAGGSNFNQPGTGGGYCDYSGFYTVAMWSGRPSGTAYAMYWYHYDGWITDGETIYAEQTVDSGYYNIYFV